MTIYRGPNAFRNGELKSPKQPLLVPRPVGTSAVIRQTDGPAFDNKFPKSRYPRGGGQSGLVPVLEVAGGGGGGNWILATGFWNDTGVWGDTAIWMD